MTETQVLGQIKVRIWNIKKHTRQSEMLVP